MKELKRDIRSERLWDYLTEHVPGVGSQAALKRLGADGWELVHVSAVDEDGDLWCVFKRPAVLA